STAIISRGDRLGIETTWNCSCDKGEGTCSMESAEGPPRLHEGLQRHLQRRLLSLNGGGRNYSFRWSKTKISKAALSFSPPDNSSRTRTNACSCTLAR